MDQQNGYLPNIKNKFDKNLHATFLSHIPKKKFLTKKKMFIDKRGIFSEIFKSKTNGQFSIFSINPRKKRGGHFHHTKNEKFVLISGKSIFSTYDIKSKKKYKFYLKDNTLNEIISVPGQWHEIENIGKSKAYFLLWSNEVYNKKRPDTYN